jgi:hypothetical protein
MAFMEKHRELMASYMKMDKVRRWRANGELYATG